MSLVLPRKLDVAELCEEAAERAGIEFRSGYALTSAKRSLELLSIDWANRGLNLWCIDKLTLPYTTSGELIDLPADTIDVIDVVWFDNYYGSAYSVGYQLDRVPLGDVPSYTALRSYQQTGTAYPTGYWVHRTQEPPALHLWPPLREDLWPNCSLTVWRLRYMAGLNAGGTDSPELPYRLQPAMVAGLAFMLALKSKDPAAQQRVPMLKQMYEEDFDLAAQEDRDRSNVYFTPDMR